MEIEKFKERKRVKLGKNYLVGGMFFIIIGVIIFSFSYILWNSIVSSLPSAIEHNSIVGSLVWTFMSGFFFLGIFYFFWGLYKLRKIIKKISNKVRIYYGASSLIICLPFIFYGYITSILCGPTSCLWHPSVLQLVTISLGVVLLISSLICLIYELLKIKGDPLESYFMEQMKEISIEPITEALYKVRIEKLGEDLEQINYICGNCGEKNNFESLNDELGLLKCINCGSKNHLEK